MRPTALAHLVTLVLVATVPTRATADVRDDVRAKVAAEYPSLRQLYEHLHAHPELSWMEVKTAALVARELRAAGLEVTEDVGRRGVVGVLRNGPGQTVLLRADL